MKTIRIKDYYGIYQEIPVSDELYEEWRALQNETQRVHRKEVYGHAASPIGTHKPRFSAREHKEISCTASSVSLPERYIRLHYAT